MDRVVQFCVIISKKSHTLTRRTHEARHQESDEKNGDVLSTLSSFNDMRTLSRVAPAPFTASKRTNASSTSARRWSSSSTVTRAGSEDETLRSFDPDMVGYIAPELLVSNLTVRDIEDDDDEGCVGKGAFSECFLGTLRADDGADVDVVVKKYLAVPGRDVASFYDDEWDACRVLRTCPGVAPFLGAAGVKQYLVWENVGLVTLENALEGGDDAFQVARDAMPSALSSAKTDAECFIAIAKALTASIAAIHGNDIIHRDVKPSNVLLSDARGVVLCDLGAAADVETGRGMDGEAIFDPIYGAPEQFEIVQTGGGMLGGLFGRKNADKSSIELRATGETPTFLFDAFSLGITLLRLGVPSLRSATAIAQARKDIDACGGDIVRWRNEICVAGVNDWSLVDGTGAWETITRLTHPLPSARLSVGEAEFK